MFTPAASPPCTSCYTDCNGPYICSLFGLTEHREIYVKQHSLVSNMISKAKKDYLCHKIINWGSSRELFRLSSQMMGKFGDTMLPSNVSPESPPDKFNEFFVHKTEEIRDSFDPDRPMPTNPVEFSGTVFAVSTCK